MAVFDSIDQTTDKAISRSEDFIRNTEAYYELKLFQMLTSSLTLIIKFTIIGAFALIAFILLAVAAASLIGNLAGSDTLGYVYTAGIFLILAFIIYGLRKKIENSIIKNLSTRIYKDL